MFAFPSSGVDVNQSAPKIWRRAKISPSYQCEIGRWNQKVKILRSSNWTRLHTRAQVQTIRWHVNKCVSPSKSSERIDTKFIENFTGQRHSKLNTCISSASMCMCMEWTEIMTQMLQSAFKMCTYFTYRCNMHRERHSIITVQYRHRWFPFKYLFITTITTINVNSVN